MIKECVEKEGNCNLHLPPQNETSLSRPKENDKKETEWERERKCVKIVKSYKAINQMYICTFLCKDKTPRSYL